MTDKIIFRFLGQQGGLLTGFLNGIPARDLGEDDWARLSERERMTVEKCGLYAAVEQEHEDEPAELGA